MNPPPRYSLPPSPSQTLAARPTPAPPASPPQLQAVELEAAVHARGGDELGVVAESHPRGEAAVLWGGERSAHPPVLLPPRRPRAGEPPRGSLTGVGSALRPRAHPAELGEPPRLRRGGHLAAIPRTPTPAPHL